jgi:hypothetical protein
MAQIALENWKSNRPDGPCRFALKTLLRRFLFKGSDATLSEDPLIQEARRFDRAQSQGLVNLEAECAKYSPIFQISLAREAFCLAGKAGVCQKAAFLALLGQFEK